MTLLDFLSVINDVNVSSKSNSRKICVKNYFVGGILEVNDDSRIWIEDPDLNPDPNPDPIVRGMDPQIRIRIHPKMSWIRNTAMCTAEQIRVYGY